MTDIVALLNDWNSRNDSAKYRNELRHAAKAAGFNPISELGEFVKSELVAAAVAKPALLPAPTPSPTPIDPDTRPMMRDDFFGFLRYVLTTGYAGQGMRDPVEAMEWVEINLKLQEPFDTLPDDAKRFWSKFDSAFARWEIRRNREAGASQ